MVVAQKSRGSKCLGGVHRQKAAHEQSHGKAGVWGQSSAPSPSAVNVLRRHIRIHGMPGGEGGSPRQSCSKITGIVAAWARHSPHVQKAGNDNEKPPAKTKYRVPIRADVIHFKFLIQRKSWTNRERGRHE